MTKIRNDQGLSFYISHVEHNPSNILLVICPSDSTEHFKTTSIGRLEPMQIHMVQSNKSWADVKTIVSTRKCKPYIIENMWCDLIAKKPYENEIVFKLNNSNIRIRANVKNKDTSIFFAKDIKLRTLLEDFDYVLETSK